MDYEDLYTFLSELEADSFHHTWVEEGYRSAEKLATHLLGIDGWKVWGGWHDGERDSFGPLTRWCEVRNAKGQVKHLIYG